MLAGFKGVNDSLIMEEVIIGSADVKALYPSLDISFTVEKVYVFLLVVNELVL